MLLVCLELKQSAHTLTFTGTRVEQRIAGTQAAGVHPHEDHAAFVPVAPELERQRARRSLRIGGERHRFTRVGVTALRGRFIQRAGQVSDHGIQQRRYADVLERRTTDNRHETTRERLAADRRFQLGLDDLFLLQEEVANRFVDLSEGLYDFHTGCMGQGLSFRRHTHDGDVSR